MAKTITVQAGGFVNIEDFKEFIDINKIAYYEFKLGTNKTITLKFYDKKKKLIRPNK